LIKQELYPVKTRRKLKGASPQGRRIRVFTKKGCLATNHQGPEKGIHIFRAQLKRNQQYLGRGFRNNKKGEWVKIKSLRLHQDEISGQKCQREKGTSLDRNTTPEEIDDMIALQTKVKGGQWGDLTMTGEGIDGESDKS